jgi:O-antigen/teichoic acid export membrane protein
MLIALPINFFINWNSVLKAVNIPPSELQTLTAITICFVLIGFIMQTVVVLYAADGNTVMGNVIQLVINLICLVLLWMAKTFATKGSLIVLGTILTGIPLIVYLIFSIYVFSGKYSYMRPSWSHVNLRQSGDLFKLSWQFFIIQITATILYASTPFVITRFYSPHEVTQYNIASTIFNFAITIIAMITAPVGPLVTQAIAKDDLAWVRNMLKRINKLAWLISLGCVVLVFVSPWIYKIWVGDRVSVPFMLSVVVCLYTITNIITNPYSVFLNSTGQVRILVILAPLTIILFWGGCYFYSWLLKDVISIPIALLTANLSGLYIMPKVLNRIINK